MTGNQNVGLVLPAVDDVIIQSFQLICADLGSD